MQETYKEKNEKKLIKLPDRTLYDYELIKYARLLKIPHFIGVFSRDRLSAKSKHTESAIVNLDSVKHSGTHWVAYTKIGRKVNYYDSFGNLPPPLELQAYFNGCDIKYNYERHQTFGTSSCGRLCLQFLSCTQFR